MEMGSSSSPASGASASTDSLNGLKFGKKIYFEDVSDGVSAKASALSISSSSSSPATVMETATATPRRGRGAVQGGQPPRCQVEGCKVDLTGAKAYYCRHKVCGTHSKSPKVIVNGLEQRFCQQCSRFHQLPEFDQGKRSCRRRLAGHNERRRKPPPLRSSISSYGQLPSSFHEYVNTIGSFPLEFARPRSPGRSVWASVRTGLGEQITSNQSPRLGSAEVSSANVFTRETEQYLQDSSGGTAFPGLDIPSSESFAGISNTSCALSLLSEPWGLRNRACGDMASNLMNNEGAPMAQPSHSSVTNNFTSNMWSFKSQDGSSGSHRAPFALGVDHDPEPIGSQFSDELDSAGQGSKQYRDRGQHGPYGSSSNQMHWSL